ncbi:MAG: hypothetical protein A2145_05740 [candidate division Zixibacteria bacterium RBG_16_40_9]|nr:MAG: hypothetical protein A2145_05740 [candidate division Zixibacteria bacterium RBG_16_40_9]
MSKLKLFLFLILFAATSSLFAQGDTAWVRHYNGAGNGQDEAVAMALDDTGNVYVTGYTWNGTSLDFTTIKYDSSGNILWARHYNGPFSVDDQAVDLELDQNGYLYVTGNSQGVTTDAATIKYAPNGDPVWVRRYNGPSKAEESITDLAVDLNGNVYITGSREDSLSLEVTNINLLIIKYSPSGALLWNKIYDRGTTSIDFGNSMAVDDSGNVYVTGSSAGTLTGEDFTTIKYNSNGDTVWVRHYNGSANQNDQAQEIKLDHNGHFYVTGQSRGSGTSDDFATIKYKANGDTLWVRRYNGTGNGADQPLALTLDDSGFVYVSGYSWNGTSFDYLTIKYDSIGNMSWVRTYNGPGNGTDQVLANEVDEMGSVYITGFSFGSGTGEDFATIDYTNDGTVHGTRRFNGPANGNDRASDLAVDKKFIYVTGRSKVGTNDNFTTIKYFKNLEPILDSIGPRSVAEGSNLTFRVHATDPNGTIPVLTAANLPLNATFVDSGNGSGSFSFNPDYNQEGLFNVTFRASDGVLVDTEVVVITVINTNRAPILSVDNGKSGIRNSTIIVPVYSFDLDGVIPTLSASNLPANSSFIDSLNGKGTLIFNPDNSQVGVHSNITFVASDGFLDDTATTQIHVFIRQDTLSLFAYSPVNLVITDPKQDSLGVGFNTVLEYSEYDTTQDVNSDGKNDDVVTILSPYLGDYNIRVLPTDTGDFTLQYLLNGNSPTFLARDVRIVNIDTTYSYQLKILETLRGDPNRDGKQNLADLIFLVNFVFKGGPEPYPYSLGNINCDFTSGGVDVINIADIIAMVNFVFKGGKAPCS